MNKLKLFKSWSQEVALLEKYVKEKSTSESVLNILEAGCGREWPLNLAGTKYTLTGIDMDDVALNHRKTVVNDLDETIIGDLRDIDLEENKYDLIYNSFVLEHIDNAELVLNKFFSWLKLGGILILKIPDRNSVFGFTTRATPHWFHVFFRKILGHKNAGRLGYGPYPTIYDSIVSRKGIHEYCQRNSHIIKEEYGCGLFFNRPGYISFLMRLYSRIMGILSFGQLSSKHNNLTYIIEKNSEPNNTVK